MQRKFRSVNRRANYDKRKAVLGMLADFADWSDRAIAKHVGVAHTIVAAILSPEVAAKQGASRAASAAKKVESDSTLRLAVVSYSLAPPKPDRARSASHNRAGPSKMAR